MVVEKEPNKKPSTDDTQEDDDAFEDYLEEYDSLNRDMDQLAGVLDRLEQSTLEVQQKARELLNVNKDLNSSNKPESPSTSGNGQTQS